VQADCSAIMRLPEVITNTVVCLLEQQELLDLPKPMTSGAAITSGGRSGASSRKRQGTAAASRKRASPHKQPSPEKRTPRDEAARARNARNQQLHRQRQRVSHSWTPHASKPQLMPDFLTASWHEANKASCCSFRCSCSAHALQIFGDTLSLASDCGQVSPACGLLPDCLNWHYQMYLDFQ
jgi:hypothetical protein